MVVFVTMKEAASGPQQIKEYRKRFCGIRGEETNPESINRAVITLL
jgi:hypothetical protein